MRKIKKVIIHCSASEDMTTAASIKRFHTDKEPHGKGWKDIGYHYVINKKGVIEFGRKEEIIGAHCIFHNEDSIGICLGGENNFTYEQIAALQILVREILLKYNLGPNDVYGHFEWDKSGKTCPNPMSILRALFKGEKKL